VVQEAMKVIEIGQPEQLEIFAIVASVLHLGNIKFVQNDKGYAEILSHDASTANVADVSFFDKLQFNDKVFILFTT
jgi:myosin heavy subunit